MQSFSQYTKISEMRWTVDQNIKLSGKVFGVVSNEQNVGETGFRVYPLAELGRSF